MERSTVKQYQLDSGVENSEMHKMQQELIEKNKELMEKNKELQITLADMKATQKQSEEVEKMACGQKISADLLDQISALVVHDVQPRTSWRASKDFRLQIIRTLAKRVIKQALKNAGVVIQ